MVQKLLLFLAVFNLNLAAQQIDWISLSATPNGPVACLKTYNGSLVACGKFDSVGNLSVNKIASWNGTNWSQLGKGLRGKNSVAHRIYEIGNDLYAVGNFDSAGTVASKDIAKWNGVSWSNLGSGSDSIIYCLALYNNEIYAAGHFKNISGILANNVAKWNGNTWQPVGSGIKGNRVRDLCVFQSELYALGEIDTVNNNIPCNYIAKWNGSSWDSLPKALMYDPNGFGPNIAMIVWQNKLLVTTSGYSPFGGGYDCIKQWDGTNWSFFKNAIPSWNRVFAVYNSQLYSGSGSFPVPGYSYVNVWDNINSWFYVGKGISDNVWGLCVYNGELYCGGDFKIATGSYHNFIARLGNTTGLPIVSDKGSIQVFPNPVHEKLYLKAEMGFECIIECKIVDIYGNCREFKLKQSDTKEIDLSAYIPGIYYLNAKTESEHKVFKIVKE